VESTESASECTVSAVQVLKDEQERRIEAGKVQMEATVRITRDSTSHLTEDMIESR